MDGIFDGPVTAARNLDLSRAQLSGWAAGEEDFGFFGNLNGFEMMSRPDNDRRLGSVREARVMRIDFEGIDLTGFMSAVTLVQSKIRREKKRRPVPWKGGRVFGKAWVDWL